ncbi:MAG: hypothetical protein ACLP2Y_15495 [Limisphaerales bacterium]
MKVIKPKAAPKPRKFFSAPVLLAVILAALFWKSFLPDYVLFSNDGPLGQQNTSWSQLPAAFTGTWWDLNDIGGNAGSYPLDLSALIRWVLSPVAFAKFFQPLGLFILGLGAWTFLRALKLTPLAALLGAMAAMLNSVFFAGACWGVASVEIALGMGFFALALVTANTLEMPWSGRWTRLALAGACVGVNVMEAADVGALVSLFIAAFVFFKSLVDEEGLGIGKIARSIGRVAVVAVFAGFIAMQTVLSLVGNSIQGIAGTAQDAETKAQHWDWATQWSLPKKETLGIVVPGLFGYRQDTPNKMPPSLQKEYEGGVYWGGMGRSPEIDRFFDSGGQGTPPDGMMRFGYGGYYCGILVALVALWAIAQSLRRQNSPFSGGQKKFIWFWAAVMIASLLLAWGRFAPMFYGLLYQLPYFSAIRNPAKFFIFLAWAMVVLFAYGIHALARCHLESAPAKSFTAKVAIGKRDAFDRKWTFACAGVFGASVIGWLVFSWEKAGFIQYLQKVGFPDEETAARIGSVGSNQIAAFCLSQVAWFLILLAIALTLLTLVITGFFSGPRAKLGAVLLGAFLVFDLGRANLPFIIHWDYKQKYEIGSLNPTVEFLRDKPYEHRVAGLPDAQQPLRFYDNSFGSYGLYRIEWMQHHFPYYNIQCLDIIQMPRMPEDLEAYLNALTPHTQADAPLLARHWELTNTRYLLGAAGFLNILNQQFDPGQNRFQIAQRFDVVAKPGIAHPTQLEELTVTTNNDGDLALFEFTGALPRAKLYASWQVNTNDQANLKTLADLNFDPAKTVLISTPQKDLPAVATNENSGTVDFKRYVPDDPVFKGKRNGLWKQSGYCYAPKNIMFDAKATTPSVLLLNDRFDPHWRVFVDGKPAELLRCNFIMRGVYLTPGQHTVEFDFSLPHKPFYVTLTGIAIGLGLAGYLLISAKREPPVRREIVTA